MAEIDRTRRFPMIVFMERGISGYLHTFERLSQRITAVKAGFSASHLKSVSFPASIMYTYMDAW
ncbi:hypothetical protein [Nitratireductor luteus]|uniref:hypothetical protein n=1 Tax=Nitratireductor luteus TaxID=2976980 RepID=UPI00223FCCB1|nr:hypothetical protein [Nitratireductor luteus]